MRRALTDGTWRAGVLGLVIGLIGGMTLGVAGPWFRSGPPPEAEGTGVAAAFRSAGRAWSPPPCWAVEKEVQHVRAEIALALQTTEDVRVRVEGVPIPWSAARGDQFLPHAFETAMAEAEADCPDVDILRVDCEEPPCFAWVQPPATDRGSDGRLAHGALWGTPRAWTFEKGDPDFEANVEKRIRTRMGAAEESWPCPEDPSP